MNKAELKKQCTLGDCKELKKLIVENPDLPLLIFAGEEAWNGEFSYSQCVSPRCEIENLTLYGDVWLEEDDYEERLSDDLCDDEDYAELSDEEFNKVIAKKVEETEFVKAITVYVG